MSEFPQVMVISGDGACCDISDLKETTIQSSFTTRSQNVADSNNEDCWDFSNYGDIQSSTMNGDSGNTDEHKNTSRNRHHHQLHGRQDEIATMKECFTEVASNGAAQLLLVSGVSGSGKSALVEQMRNFVTSSKRHGFFCKGKFEQRLLEGTTTNEPFSALATAFSDVIDFILNQQRSHIKERSQAVSEALGSDRPMLVDIVPNLSLLLGAAHELPDNTAAYTNFAEARSKEGASTKTGTNLALLFRNFLRSLTCRETPILLFLDDLQFADQDSLDVFRALVTDSSLKYVLIVGSFRSTETSVAELLLSSPVAAVADSTNATAAVSTMTTLLSTKTIHIGDLDLSAVNRGLAQKLGLDEETTEPLSTVVLQKSGGNPFYVSQYVTMLQENELLLYVYDEAEEKMKWTWDIYEISMMTNISNNVLELVSQRLQALPENTIALLTLIAFFGFRFDCERVEMVLRQLAATSSTTTYTSENQCVVNKAVALLGDGTPVANNIAAVQIVLQLAVKDGLIEKCAGVMFKFTHDRVQQALYEMIKEESARSELHYYIGQAVSSLALNNMEEKKTSLFFIADQLNRGIAHFTEEVELIELAETNLKAGKVAAFRAGYQSAATYLRSAMKILNKDVKYWNTHYSLMIDLCSSKAEIEAKMSNFERSREICELVLEKGLSLDDKVRAYVCLVSSYCTQESLDDAVRIGMEFLSQVGIKLPKNPTRAHVVVNLTQTKKCMYKVSDSMILESPLMSDNKMAKAIDVLTTLATAYYIMANAGEMFVIIIMRIVQLTRRFGVTETTARGFAYFGLLNSSAGNGKQALRYGNLALALVQSTTQDNTHVEPSVLAILYHFVMWWKIPVQECKEPFLRGMTIGKKQGDLEWAYFCGNGLVSAMFHSGHDLYETLEVTRDLCAEMIEYEVHTPARGTMPYWQIVENLTGNSDNTYKLTGNAMNEDETVRQAEEHKNLISLETINSVRLCAAVIFRQWDLASELAPLVVSGIKFLDAHFWGFTVRLYLGLTYSESYLRHGRRKDLRRLLKTIRELKKLENNGVKENCKPLRLILQAELAATERSNKVSKNEATKELYEKAIEQCHTQELIHYEAIAGERASRVCQLHSDKAGAVQFLNHAENCYRDWGAEAKVEEMRKKSFRPR